MKGNPIRGWLPAAAVIVLCALCPAAYAASESLDSEYLVSWRGIEVGRLSTGLLIDEDLYELTYGARTTGLLGIFFPFESEGSASGRLAGSKPSPRDFSGTRNRGNETRSWRLLFNSDGNVLEREVDDADLVDRDEVPPELWQAPDPMSLMLQAILEVGPGVTASGRAFDGRRVFDASLGCDHEQSEVKGKEELRCNLRGELIAGASERWRERRKDLPDDRHIAVWLSQHIRDHGWWPVRMEAETSYGTIAVTLVDSMKR